MATQPANPSPSPVRALSAWWAGLPRARRVNVALYALTALSMVGLLLELSVGDESPGDVNLASRGPSSTLTLRSVPSTTTSTSTSTSSTTSTTAPTTSTSAPAATPTTRAAPTTRRTVPPPEPTSPPPTEPPPTAPPPTDPPTTTTEPPLSPTTTQGASAAGLLEAPFSFPAPF